MRRGECGYGYITPLRMKPVHTPAMKLISAFLGLVCVALVGTGVAARQAKPRQLPPPDRKSTRLNSSH